jgi:hypothetical protein
MTCREHPTAVNSKTVTDIESGVDRVSRCNCNRFTAARYDIEVPAEKAAAERSRHYQEITGSGSVSPPASSWWNTSDGCDTYDKGAVPCVGVAARKCYVERIHFLLDSIKKVFS